MRLARAIAFGGLVVALLTPTSRVTAAELTVRVGGIASSIGEIGCALFSATPAFPMDASSARQIWVKADVAGVFCRFDGVAEGIWAVSVSHDLNGNRKLDTNVFGMPTEAWGVSNNVRPSRRAPRFDEAAFEVTAASLDIDIRVAR